MRAEPMQSDTMQADLAWADPVQDPLTYVVFDLKRPGKKEEKREERKVERKALSRRALTLVSQKLIY